MARHIQLKTLRNRKKLSQKQLAEATGVTRAYVGMLEQGKRTPRISVAGQMARTLGVSIEELFGE